MKTSDWHPWFAWKPVLTVDSRFAWFVRLERRRDWVYYGQDGWSYRYPATKNGDTV